MKKGISLLLTLALCLTALAGAMYHRIYINIKPVGRRITKAGAYAIRDMLRLFVCP